jgi:carbamoylphosphate synthase large subunit
VRADISLPDDDAFARILAMAANTHTIWVSAAGSGPGFGLIRSIRDGWGDAVRVVSADINPPELVASAALADEAIRTPLVSDPNFVEFLLAQLVRTGADTYAPILDAEIALAAELRDNGRLPDGVVTTAPSSHTAHLCLDKFEMSRWLAEHDLPSPATWPLTEVSWKPGGLIAKPREGLGSVGFRRLETAAALTEAAEGPDADDLIAQEPCEGPEVTVDVFRPRRGGPISAVCRERIEVKAGVCTKARVFMDQALTDLAATLGEALPLGGAFCFQVMRSPGGEWAVTDVNPRHGAGSRMSAAVGVDVIGAGLADVWGEDPARFLGKLDGDRHVVRQYAEYT